MNVNEIRRLNLDKAIGSPGKHGRIRAFAEKYDLDASFISQVLNGHRMLGEKGARKMETKANLPAGSLDRDPSNNKASEPNAAYLMESLPDELRVLVERYENSSEEIQQAVLRILEAVEEKDPKKPK